MEKDIFENNIEISIKDVQAFYFEGGVSKFWEEVISIFFFWGGDSTPHLFDIQALHYGSRELQNL